MQWVYFGILMVLSRVLWEAISKKLLKGMDEYTIVWGLSFFGCIFLLPFLVVSGTAVSLELVWLLVVASVISLAGRLTYMHAIKISDLSYVAPINNFGPLFAIPVGYLLVQELPGIASLWGILLTVAGAYLLSVREYKEGFLRPLYSLVTRRGPRFMLIATFTAAVMTAIDKIALTQTSAIMWLFLVNLTHMLFLTPHMMKDRRRFRVFKKSILAICFVGLFFTLTLFFQLLAIQLTLIANVLAIKRLSVLVSVVYGGMILKEKDLGWRLIAAAVMLMGAVLITAF